MMGLRYGVKSLVISFYLRTTKDWTGQSANEQIGLVMEREELFFCSKFFILQEKCSIWTCQVQHSYQRIEEDKNYDLFAQVNGINLELVSLLHSNTLKQVMNEGLSLLSRRQRM